MLHFGEDFKMEIEIYFIPTEIVIGSGLGSIKCLLSIRRTNKLMVIVAGIKFLLLGHNAMLSSATVRVF